MNPLPYVYDWYHRLSPWGKIGIIYGAIVCVDAMRMSWGEKRLVGGFFESFVAIGFWWLPVAALFAAPFWGEAIAKKSGLIALGWIVGIAIVVVGMLARNLAEIIPGIGWRLKEMEKAREEAIVDY